MLSLGVSFADVSISGSVNQTIGSWNDSGVLIKDNKFSAIGDRNLATGDSLITFAGSEDLGDGLKASFKFEPRINISGSDTSQSTQKGNPIDESLRQSTRLMPTKGWTIFFFRGNSWSHPLSSQEPNQRSPDAVRIVLQLATPTEKAATSALTVDWVHPAFNPNRT